MGQDAARGEMERRFARTRRGTVARSEHDGVVHHRVRKAQHARGAQRVLLVFDDELEHLLGPWGVCRTAHPAFLPGLGRRQPGGGRRHPCNRNRLVDERLEPGTPRGRIGRRGGAGKQEKEKRDAAHYFAAAAGLAAGLAAGACAGAKTNCQSEYFAFPSNAASRTANPPVLSGLSSERLWTPAKPPSADLTRPHSSLPVIGSA